MFCVSQEQPEETHPDPLAADLYRLGGEYGLGGWGGVNLGGFRGEIEVLDGGRVITTGVAAEGAEADVGPYNADPQDNLFVRAELGDVSSRLSGGFW